MRSCILCRSYWHDADAGTVSTSLPITPIFVLPYKRYASSSILPLAQQYLQKDQDSYRDVVQPKGIVTGYLASADAPIDERALAPSTVWRWLAYLGTQVAAWQVGLELWQQHDPQSTLHRFRGLVAPHKFRSPPRGKVLRLARRLLTLRDRWDRTFREKFFPRFATRSGVP